MPTISSLPTSSSRAMQVRQAIRLATISVIFGLASGAVSVTSGLRDHSLGVLAVGLGVLADVTGSATLIWRFRAELREPALSAGRERRSAGVVALALAVVAVVLAVESITALVQGSRPASSGVTIAAAGVSLVVLVPLAVAKRRLGDRLSSRALKGDGTLSGVGAATSFLALAALIIFRLLGWWWTDRVAALVVAAISAAEAWRTARQR